MVSLNCLIGRNFEIKGFSLMYKQYEEEELKKVQNIQKEILVAFDKFCQEHELHYFLVFGSALGAARHQGFIPWDDDIDVGMLREDYDKLMSLKHLFDPQYEILTTATNKYYCNTVTHVHKKNTTFISEYTQHMKCHLGIPIDIFVYDKVPEDEKKRKSQMLQTYFWGRLLFLKGTGKPEIPLTGVVGFIARVICMIAHFLLTIFFIPSRWIYARLLKVSKKYNHMDYKVVTCFEDATPWKDMISLDELYPLKRIKYEDIETYIPNKNHEILTRTYGDYMQLPPVEKRVNHSPVVLDFGENNANE